MKKVLATLPPHYKNIVNVYHTSFIIHVTMSIVSTTDNRYFGVCLRFYVLSIPHTIYPHYTNIWLCQRTMILYKLAVNLQRVCTLTPYLRVRCILYLEKNRTA